MANRPGPGVVAVSGGADSVALVRALHACSISLIVAHVNHKLRGPESDADEAFVRELCATLGVPCRAESVDVAALAAGENLESTARRVRYGFFADVATEVGAAWIATAHTADDQAETVLHRLIRGTGLQGLRGIAREAGPLAPASLSASRGPTPPTPLPAGRGESGGIASCASENVDGLGMPDSPLPAGRGVGCLLLRPLLTLTRADVLAHLAAINQPYREDASNADPRFTRNRIRHELLPLLRTFNPDVVSALGHLAEHANEAHVVLATAAAELLARAERPRAGGTIILDAATLLAVPRAVLRVALRLVWEREGWSMSEMTFDAWERAIEVAGRDTGAWDFPGGVTVRHAGRVVQIAPRK
jgi:tRNA(Ile)-lysidine synthase